jgi:hypothetical protein
MYSTEAMVLGKVGMVTRCGNQVFPTLDPKTRIRQSCRPSLALCWNRSWLSGRSFQLQDPTQLSSRYSVSRNVVHMSQVRQEDVLFSLSDDTLRRQCSGKVPWEIENNATADCQEFVLYHWYLTDIATPSTCRAETMGWQAHSRGCCLGSHDPRHFETYHVNSTPRCTSMPRRYAPMLQYPEVGVFVAFVLFSWRNQQAIKTAVSTRLLSKLVYLLWV